MQYKSIVNILLKATYNLLQNGADRKKNRFRFVIAFE